MFAAFRQPRVEERDKGISDNAECRKELKRLCSEDLDRFTARVPANSAARLPKLRALHAG